MTGLFWIKNNHLSVKLIWIHLSITTLVLSFLHCVMSLSPRSKTNLAISKSYFHKRQSSLSSYFFFHSNTTVIHFFFTFLNLGFGDRLKILLITMLHYENKQALKISCHILTIRLTTILKKFIFFLFCGELYLVHLRPVFSLHTASREDFLFVH